MGTIGEMKINEEYEKWLDSLDNKIEEHFGHVQSDDMTDLIGFVPYDSSLENDIENELEE